jgi:methylase of polypeptide subunit release factors
MGKHVRVFGYDYSESAIELAQENIDLHKLDITVRRTDIMRDDFTSTVISDMGGRVDLVVSNPPYVTANEYSSLPASVRDWEDPAALLGSTAPDSQGLEFYHRIGRLLPALLTSEKDLHEAGWTGIPRVAVEIGAEQGTQVQQIIVQSGGRFTELWQDQYDRDRMILGWL